MFKLFFEKLLYGLSRKFILYFVVITVIPPMVLAYLGIRNFDSTNQQEIFNRLEGIAELKSSELNRFFEQKKHALETLARLSLLTRRLESMVQDEESGALPRHLQTHEEIREILSSIEASDPDFFEIFFVTPEGEIHISSDRAQEGKLASKKPYFTEAQGGTYISDIFFSIQYNKLALTISTPFYGEQGTWLGVIVAQADLERINSIMQQDTGLKQTGETYLVNMLNFFVTDPRSQKGLSLNKTIYTDATDRCLQQNNGTLMYKNYADREVFGAYRWVPTAQVCLLAEIQRQEAFAPFNAFRLLMGMIALVVVIIVIAVGLFMARSLIRPIRDLQKGAREIGLGNLDYVFRIATNDELEDLAAEFDKMRLQLKQIRTREEALSKIKSEFVSIVAHQLRTPLSAIKWALALMTDTSSSLPAEQKELLAKIHISNERMIRLVNDLLDAARIEEGRFVYERVSVSFTEIAKSVLEAIKDKSKRKRVRVTFKESKEPLPSLYVDKDAMELALQNLLENAIQYTLPGGTVFISASLGEKELIVSVRDTGIGVAEEEKERVFTKFFRGTNALRLETEGSGLGLFIVKNIVEAHGGKIWFESQEGKGTTFFFTIPLKDQ